MGLELDAPRFELRLRFITTVHSWLAPVKWVQQLRRLQGLG